MTYGLAQNSKTRQILLSTLKLLGYTTIELLLTPLQFMIPNSRLRYYLLAKTKPLSFSCSQAPDGDYIWRHIPGRGVAWVDPRLLDDLGTNSVDELNGYLDTNIPAGESHPHAVPDRVLLKWGRLFDIVLPSSRRSCCFTRGCIYLRRKMQAYSYQYLLSGYTQLVERAGSILQMNQTLDVRLYDTLNLSTYLFTYQTATVFNAFAQAQAAGDAEVERILDPLQLRYFSPSELLRLFHFDAPSENSHVSGVQQPFLWPESISTKTKYRLIGNSVNVKVMTALIDFLFEEDNPPDLRL